MKGASTRIFLFVTCLAFSSPLLAEDLASLFQRIASEPGQFDAAFPQFTAAGQRIGQEDATSAQKEIAELAAVYDQHPETRKIIGVFLQSVVVERLTIFGGANDAFIAPFQPIVLVMIAHLYDGDPASREAPMPLLLFWSFKQNPSVDILQPMIDLSRTESKPSGALSVVAMFCNKSKQAVFALRDAMGPDQPFEKRLDAIQVITNSGGPTCTDPELVSALSVALKSDWPDGTDPIIHTGRDRNGESLEYSEGGRTALVEAAVKAAKRLGPAAGPLKADLERIAADKDHPVTAAAAKEALGQLQR